MHEIIIEIPDENVFFDNQNIIKFEYQILYLIYTKNISIYIKSI